MGWGNIYARRMKVFTVALIIYIDYKTLEKREKWIRPDKRSSLWEKAHERNARRLLNLVIELEGLWVKLGQYLSTRADVLPESYTSLLKQLQDSLPPRPLKEVCRTIVKELGKPMNDLFSAFVERPLATASIAQVHRATLSNGQEVVVKVQHEGIKEVILEDLKNAKSIVDWIAWAEPQYDFNPMIDEWCKEAPKELDFNHEAENTRQVSKNLSCGKCDETQDNYVDVLIPEVIQSSEKVLILEFMDGIRLNDIKSLEENGVDKQKLIEEITRAYAHQIYVDGFFNGDPHPGNFLVSKITPHRPILLDFGLTKSISSNMKQALAKMFLASIEGDQVALLSAFAEMGLKLRLDIPEQAMNVTTIFFRESTPANEYQEHLESMVALREKNMKAFQEKTKLGKKEMARFNPVDAFPGDAVIFLRVINLLRGLSSMMNVRIVYSNVMRPFAESTLLGNIKKELNSPWICNTDINSVVETKLRHHLSSIWKDKILGIQVCAYKDGKVIIDTAAGVLGKYDPRPVQPDSLFPVFSVTKGITAGILHWLVDKGKLNYEENVASIWPDFQRDKEIQIKVHHVLNHTSGLHNAMADIMKENPLLICDWDKSLTQMAIFTPETEPGREQLYHYLSFGWLCGGLIEYASGKKFQEVLEEAIIQPLDIGGELYIGIPPGVESRLATLTLDMDDLVKVAEIPRRPDMPSTFQTNNLSEFFSGFAFLFNSLPVRRAIIPAANGHLSARALARYYATLAAGGKIPPPHTSSEPSLGSHPHIPKFPSLLSQNKKKKAKTRNKQSKPIEHMDDSDSKTNFNCGNTDSSSSNHMNGVYKRSSINSNVDEDIISTIFTNPRIHDAFMGLGDYENLTLPNGNFGLGFRRFNTNRDPTTCFGHSGIGGSTGFCNIEHNFSIAITVNKMSLGGLTRSIIQLVCSELNIPIPEDFSSLGGFLQVN